MTLGFIPRASTLSFIGFHPRIVPVIRHRLGVRAERNSPNCRTAEISDDLERRIRSTASLQPMMMPWPSSWPLLDDKVVIRHL